MPRLSCGATYGKLQARGKLYKLVQGRRFACGRSLTWKFAKRSDEMLSALDRWRSFSRNANFWDWVRDTYSDNELQRLAQEATDGHLIDSYDPLGDETMDQFARAAKVRRTMVKRLLSRYGDEIWSCCLGAANYDASNKTVALECLAKLDLAFEVFSQSTFEEFLVRNALKRASQQLIADRRGKRI